MSGTYQELINFTFIFTSKADLYFWFLEDCLAIWRQDRPRIEQDEPLVGGGRGWCVALLSLAPAH